MDLENKYDQTPLYRIMLVLSWVVVIGLFAVIGYFIVELPFSLLIILLSILLGFIIGLLATLAIIGIIAFLGWILMKKFDFNKVFKWYNNMLLRSFGKIKPEFKQNIINKLKD